jgi:hypothetical protein
MYPERLRGRVGFRYSLFVQGNVHPAAQSLLAVKRVEHSFPMAYQDECFQLAFL